jgi:hypothetical protein
MCCSWHGLISLQLCFQSNLSLKTSASLDSRCKMKVFGTSVAIGVTAMVALLPNFTLGRAMDIHKRVCVNLAGSDSASSCAGEVLTSTHTSLIEHHQPTLTGISTMASGSMTTSTHYPSGTGARHHSHSGSFSGTRTDHHHGPHSGTRSAMPHPKGPPPSGTIASSMVALTSAALSSIATASATA